VLVKEVGSPSIQSPDYWWYRARADLLQTALLPFVGSPQRGLDVGSADGPSVGWLRGTGCRWVSLDIDPRGLTPGDICGSATRLPFSDGAFDLVAAFDVIEHCDPEDAALAEVSRVLAPGGRLLMSVPAYEWAWTHFDEQNHHFRRYTRGRAAAAVARNGLEIMRASYMFAGTFPLFAASRVVTRVRERGKPAAALGADDVPQLPAVSPALEALLMSATRLERRALAKWNLPFGSSVVVAARKRDMGQGGFG
jgi:SAM-dependent methyltransferase